MTYLEERVTQKLKTLPFEKQQKVLDYIEALEAQPNVESAAEQGQSPPRMSFQEGIRKYIGCLDGGPADLSTNKAYLEGLGEE